MSEGSPNWDFKERDVAILRELSNDPQLSSRKLADILEAEYDIDVSHVTVSESVREMRERGVYREAIIPNEEYFYFALFEFKFNPEHFDDAWRDALDAVREHKNTMFFFLSDGEYQWKTIMMFRERSGASRWIHDFYKEHGKLVHNVRTTVVHNVLKFRTDPRIFEELHDGDR